MYKYAEPKVDRNYSSQVTVKMMTRDKRQCTVNLKIFISDYSPLFSVIKKDLSRYVGFFSTHYLATNIFIEGS